MWDHNYLWKQPFNYSNVMTAQLRCNNWPLHFSWVSSVLQILNIILKNKSQALAPRGKKKAPNVVLSSQNLNRIVCAWLVSPFIILTDTLCHISANVVWICLLTVSQRNPVHTRVWKPWEPSLLHSSYGIILLSSVKSKLDLSSIFQRDSSLEFWLP